MIPADARDKRQTLFDSIFEGMEGFLCVAAKVTTEKRLVEEFFRYPEELPAALDFIDRFVGTHNMYYCATLFSLPKREKNNAQDSWVAWSDLDSCRPEKLEETPTLVFETSPGRYQALWRFDRPTSPWDAEDVSRRIAYKYEADGADKSGWDLTQLLRVPFTYNHKYRGTMGSAPSVSVLSVNPVQWSVSELLEQLPQVVGYEVTSIPMPAEGDLPSEEPEEIMQRYRHTLQPIAFHLFSEEPERKKWSEALWQLQMFLLEAGMSLEEAFVVARAAACNKFDRDNRPIVYLWKDLCRAKAKFDFNLAIQTPKGMDQLLSDDERNDAAAMRTIIDDYVDWAKSVGDAAPQYHVAGAFVILSSLLAGPIKLPTSFGTVLPNLWFMIMADTTLTRKSTAMDLAMDILVEIDHDAIMATDGSIEGLLTTLQGRPGRPSVFLRDEFSGLLEAMLHKDYMAGMAETFTKLYDGKYQKRVLRKEVLEIRDPVLILFAGGIRDRILSLLSYDQVSSGFLPRFVFITAESDVTKLRPLGPPTDTSMEGRNELMQRFIELHQTYNAPAIVEVAGKQVATQPQHLAQLTQDAWSLYNHFEASMMRDALGTSQPDLTTPMFDRLSKSGLKAAVLIASLRGEEQIVVQEADLFKAFWYVEQWRMTAVDILQNVGKTQSEKQVQNVLNAILKAPPEGLIRSQLMQRQHLNAKETEGILMTLEQRGQIQRVKHGKTERLHPTIIPSQYV
jgi:hypothetical protein